MGEWENGRMGDWENVRLNGAWNELRIRRRRTHKTRIPAGISRRSSTGRIHEARFRGIVIVAVTCTILYCVYHSDGRASDSHSDPSLNVRSDHRLDLRPGPVRPCGALKCFKRDSSQELRSERPGIAGSTDALGLTTVESVGRLHSAIADEVAFRNGFHSSSITDVV
jgi:hypothetical protein